MIIAAVARLFGWRWVFLGLLPLVAMTGSLALPGLTGSGGRRVCRAGAPAYRRAADRGGGGDAAGVPEPRPALGVIPGRRADGGRVVAGLPALRRLVPPGTLTGRPGLPVTISSRGLLTFAFFGADAYVTLAVMTVRHRSPWLPASRSPASPVAWTAGAGAQARLNQVWEGTAPGEWG